MVTPKKELLVTSTREPYQPVRLTYRISNRARARSALRKLACVTSEEGRGSLTIWLTDEAREIFGAP